LKSLSTTNHDRDSAGLKYVYRVLSRRAGGVSIGINLNPNNACNWRCVYCQVPELSFGSAPPIDMAQLERELFGLIRSSLEDDSRQRNVGQDAPPIRDIAISGNGEPTSSKQLGAVIELASRAIDAFGLRGRIGLVLITNGSLVTKPHVKTALRTLAEHGGTVWFKLDSATDAGQQRVNGVPGSAARTRRNLALAARACPTWIQSMFFALDGKAPVPRERRAYLDFLRELVEAKVPVRGVLLYGLARPSHQPEAPRLSALPAEWMQELAADIGKLGLEVRVAP
jgi:wyosine [tRNA(Phe)-imidazoG37] synthetase (radical SAM superfamily)